jgi:hypothetical protein
MQNFDHNIGSGEKGQFFAENCRKSLKIVIIITSTPGLHQQPKTVRFWVRQKKDTNIPNCPSVFSKKRIWFFEGSVFSKNGFLIFQKKISFFQKTGYEIQKVCFQLLWQDINWCFFNWLFFSSQPRSPLRWPLIWMWLICQSMAWERQGREAQRPVYKQIILS